MPRHTKQDRPNQATNRPSESELLTPKILNLPYVVVRKYAREGHRDYDELISCGYWALFRAARLFDPDKPCRTGQPAVFSSFAMLCVKTNVMRLKYKLYNKSLKFPQPASLSQTTIQDCDLSSLVGRWDKERDLQEQVEEAMRVLGELEASDRELLEMRYLDGDHLHVIAERTKGEGPLVSKEMIRQRVNKAVRRARKKAKGV